MCNALLVGTQIVTELQHQIDAANSNHPEMEGDVHIKFYMYMNRVSALVLKLMEDETIPANLRVGSSFDVLLSINRADLLFSTLFTFCAKNEALTKLFFTVLHQYLDSSQITSIPKKVLIPFLDSFDAQSPQERFSLELQLMKLQYTTDIDEIMAVFVNHSYVLAATYLCVNCKGDFVQPIRIIHELIASDKNLDYFCQYPHIMDETPSTGKSNLEFLLLFLLHSAIYGVNLAGVSINSLGRVSNQEECYAYLVNETPLLHELLKTHPQFISGLLFYTLFVKMMEGETPTISIDDSDDEEAMKLRMLVEADNYRQLFASVQKTIAKGLLESLETKDLEESVQRVAFYLLLIVVCEIHVDGIDDRALAMIFQFTAEHTEIVKREQLNTIIDEYPVSDAIVDSVIRSLLSRKCVPECVKLLNRNHQFAHILQLYFSDIRETDSNDAIRDITHAIEKVMADVRF